MTEFANTAEGLYAACAANCPGVAARIVAALQAAETAPVNPTKAIAAAAKLGHIAVVQVLLPFAPGAESAKKRYVSTACMAALRAGQHEHVRAYYADAAPFYTYDELIDSKFTAKTLHTFIMDMLASTSSSGGGGGKVLVTARFLLRMTKHGLDAFTDNCAMLCRVIELGADTTYTETLLGYMVRGSARAGFHAKLRGFLAVARLNRVYHVDELYTRFIQEFSPAEHYTVAEALFQMPGMKEGVLDWFLAKCQPDGPVLSAINKKNAIHLVWNACKQSTTTTAALTVLFRNWCVTPSQTKYALMDALQYHGNPAVVAWLYAKYVDVDFQDDDHWALRFVTTRKNPELHRWLVSVRPEAYELVDEVAILRKVLLPFNHSDVLEVEADTECACCCDAMSDTALNCDHVFCRTCLETWYQSGKRSCPTCRGAIAGGRGVVTAKSKKRKLCVEAAEKRTQTM
jgi:hypothetical protein